MLTIKGRERILLSLSKDDSISDESGTERKSSRIVLNYYAIVHHVE